MKTLKLTVLLAIMLIMNSCNKQKEEIYPFYQHHFFLSIQDASGNDLIKGIDWNIWQPDKSQEENQAAMEKNKELYTLKAIYPEVYMDPVWMHYNMGAAIPDTRYCYELGIMVDGNYKINNAPFYLGFYPQHSIRHYNGRELPVAEKITYQLSCPYIFGDDATHDIITWWKQNSDGSLNALCYRIEFEGKEFTQITYDYRGSLSFATVIFDGK